MPENLAGVEHNDLAPNRLKIMFDLIIIERGGLRKDFRQEPPELGDVPLAVTKIVDKTADGFGWLNLKGLIKVAAGREHR